MKTRWGSCNINAKRIWLNWNWPRSRLWLYTIRLVTDMANMHSSQSGSPFTLESPVWFMLRRYAAGSET